MSLTKAIKFIQEDDIKGLEDMFDIDNYENFVNNELNLISQTVFELAIANRNATAVEIILNYNKNIGVYLDFEVPLKQIADNEYWELLETCKHHIRVRDVLCCENQHILSKCIEMNIIDRSEIDTIYGNMISVSAYKYLSSEMGMTFSDIKTKTIIENGLIDCNIDLYKMILTMINPKDYLDFLSINLTVSKYHELLKYVSNEDIINQISNVNNREFRFDSALIDLMGIRVKLQALMDSLEQKYIADDGIHVGISINLIKFSRLNFHKHLLYKTTVDSGCFIDVIKSLPHNYFSNQEKSKFLINSIARIGIKKYKELIKLGWKIYNNNENRNMIQSINEDFGDVYIDYNEIPKY